MSEDPTKDLSQDDVLKLILSRLDSVDMRLDGMDARLAALEAKPYDTRPIWERALAEIQEVKEQVQEANERLDRMSAKFDVINDELLTVKAEQKRLDRRVTKLEGDQA
jgi:chromosome segregation ATPase